MEYVNFGKLKVSRFILGSNPFSGFSHQDSEIDLRMKRYFTVARIKETLHTAEALGVNTLIGRSDAHVTRMLMEYWDEGGALQWFAQTCPELGGPEVSIARAAAAGASGCYIHGGVMDFLLAQKRLAEVPPLIDMIRQKGMLAGVAGHNPQVFEWAEGHIDTDFYMCCYYNSAHRDQRAEHVSGMAEWFRDEDRSVMVDLIQRIPRPVVHYKILAAGRNDPAEAFAYAACHMRAHDAVCVGVGPSDAPTMLREDVALLEKSLSAQKVPISFNEQNT
jgi:hypothetical protein